MVQKLTNYGLFCTHGPRTQDFQHRGDLCARRCDIDSGCIEHSDCATGYCNMIDPNNKVCSRMPDYVHCNNSVHDADYSESDTDCGVGCASLGKLCQAQRGTTPASTCLSNADCASALCVGDLGSKICVSCDNDIKDGHESDLDCGGTSCDRCADQKQCTKDSDCKSGMCSSGTDKTCISYFDGIQNGAETDVDCGNSPAHPCADMKMCKAHSDCKSNFCLLAPGADGSAFHLQGLCVTRVTARLSIPPLADPSPGAECQTVTDGVAAVPSIPNASGWQFCKRASNRRRADVQKLQNAGWKFCKHASNRRCAERNDASCWKQELLFAFL